MSFLETSELFEEDVQSWSAAVRCYKAVIEELQRLEEEVTKPGGPTAVPCPFLDVLVRRGDEQARLGVGKIAVKSPTLALELVRSLASVLLVQVEIHTETLAHYLKDAQRQLIQANRAESASADADRAAASA